MFISLCSLLWFSITNYYRTFQQKLPQSSKWIVKHIICPVMRKKVYKPIKSKWMTSNSDLGWIRTKFGFFLTNSWARWERYTKGQSPSSPSPSWLDEPGNGWDYEWFCFLDFCCFWIFIELCAARVFATFCQKTFGNRMSTISFGLPTEVKIFRNNLDSLLLNQ